jgi:hypothetical protein
MRGDCAGSDEQVELLVTELIRAVLKPYLERAPVRQPDRR